MLTERELKLCSDIGRIMNGFNEIAKEALAENPELLPYDQDILEISAIVHQLQNWVLSNSAARSHPTEYRPYGCIFKPKPTDFTGESK